ncbi:MAG: ATP-binding cassette domain-containing protein [Chthoniobacteraceae bacterium]|nr:ATP-binding cassette domain-containing protein [Chthoniobacteraceae bacterium]
MSKASVRPSLPVLSVAGLVLVREGNHILKGIDWQVDPGQHWAILGANGAGKTSLLSALTGYTTPTGGQIDVLGQRYGESNWPELRKQIGIVSSSVRHQMADAEPALLTVLSGKYAMIDYWGRVKSADRKEALEILRQIDAVHLAERPWRVLSQGERQRILIGRALMARPRLLILDEPCAGLDPVAREHFMQFVNRLTTAPTRGLPAPTLILVTHHVEEIVDGFSHVLALKAGRVLAAGDRSKLLKSAFLSEVFGEPVRLLRRNGRALLQVEPVTRRLFKTRPGGLRS